MVPRVILSSHKRRLDRNPVPGTRSIIELGPFTVPIAVILTVSALASKVVPAQRNALEEGRHNMRPTAGKVGGKGSDTMRTSPSIASPIEGDKESLGAFIAAEHIANKVRSRM